ncbi:hypothetical protein EUX98_g7414 [Antrodiella citrinella]|uniref:Profilin n=1 Tax=Antrodiella citrinella TaxID=2447956 RepID=A0A4S4MLL3_9APHY|nr:hypothetical protein EUX98_g7414 [Antrodiella citrinella]
MSWQTYVDSSLVGSGKIARAAILGQAGGVWATSAGYNLSDEEQKAIVHAFNDLEGVRTKGFRAANRKFFTLQAVEGGRSIYGKIGADGCILVKTKQAVLVAEYAAPTQAPEATPVVETVADWLIAAGF